jgi:hypothetical protein
MTFRRLAHAGAVATNDPDIRAYVGRVLERFAVRESSDDAGIFTHVNADSVEATEIAGWSTPTRPSPVRRCNVVLPEGRG